MGISSTTNRVVLAGDGSSATFSFPYYFTAQSQLLVYLYDTVAGNITSQTLNSDYTVSATANSQGVYASGGNVVFNSSPVATSLVVITREPSEVQNFTLQQNGLIPSTALVNQLDYLTIMVQRMNDKVSRAIQLPDGFGSSAAFDMHLPSSILLNPNMALTVNSSATGWTLGTSGAYTPNELIYAVNSSTLASFPNGGSGLVLTSNGSSAPTWTAVSLTGSSVSGTLSLSNGGTGGITPQEWGVVFASSATQLATTDAGPAGFALVSNASSAPTFQALNVSTGVTGALGITNGGTGQTSANAGFNALSPMTTQGDIIYAGSGVLATRLAAGNNTFVLTSNGPGAAPSWQAAPGGSAGSSALLVVNNLSDVPNKTLAFDNISPMTTWGDVVFSGSGNVATRLAAGTSGQFLQSKGSGVDPVWASQNYGSSSLLIANNLSDVASKPLAFANISPTTTWGDIIFAGSGNVATRLAAGTANFVLQTNGPGAAPSWVASSGGAPAGSSALLVVNNLSDVQSPTQSFKNISPMAAWGDIIYAGSGIVGTTLTAGTAGQVLTTNGPGAAPGWTSVSVVNSTVLLNITTTPGSYTYNCSPRCKKFQVEIVGGGGGGGGTAGGSNAGAGCGGAGGAYARKLIIPTASSYPYVLGAGGNGGSAGNNSGIAGSSSIFGSSVLSSAIIAGGGTGGGGSPAGSTSPVFATGGIGPSSASGGDINVPGDGGFPGICLSASQALGGRGGDTVLGQGGFGGQGTSSGVGGGGYGGGGGGASVVSGAAAQAGGPGAPGGVIITEFF